MFLYEKLNVLRIQNLLVHDYAFHVFYGLDSERYKISEKYSTFVIRD